MSSALALAGGLVVATIAIYSLAALVTRLERRRSPMDPALDIRPPRRYVDADGRSDYRPELRDAANQRRAEGRLW